MEHYFNILRLHLLVLAGLLPALPPLYAADITWQGNSNNNWTNPANWIGGAVPGAADRVFIPAVSGGQMYPQISSAAATVRYLEIQANAQLTLVSGGNLTVNGTGCSGGTCYGIYIRNNATLTIHQGATLSVQNTGSYGIYNNEGHFINNGNTSVTTTVDRGIFTTTNGTTGYNPTFTNSGTLTLSGIGSTGIYNNIESDTLLFNNTGTISLSNINASGFYNYCYRHNSRLEFINYGTISVYLCTNRGMANECRPDANTANTVFILDNYGTLTIDSTGQHGLYNYNNKGNFYFYNRTNAQITVRKVGNTANLYQRGVYNHNRQDDLSYNPYFEAHNWGTITIRQTNSQGLRNECMKNELNFTNHHIIRTSKTTDGGVMNYANNTFSEVNFANSGSIFIDTAAVYGLYNVVYLDKTADTTAVLNFINDGLIKVDSTTSYAAYNNTDNGQLSFNNNGTIMIRRAGDRGLFNRQDKDPGNFTSSFQFNNFGTVDIDYARQQGFYCYSNRQFMDCNNFNNLLINHVTQSDGLRCTAENGGSTSFTNYGNINIGNINRQGIYLSTTTGGTVTLNNQTPININNCNINGINISGLNGTVNFSNASTININNITADGIYNDCIKNDVNYNAQLQFTNDINGVININNCSDDGWYSYCQQGIHNINILGAVNISNVADVGIINSAATAGNLTLTNGSSIDVVSCGTRGWYNITDNGANITCNNNGTIDIANTGTAGVYNFCRDGIINFSNNLLLTVNNSADEAGIYNLNRKEEAPYNTTFNFTNPGQIYISNCTDHGIVFSNNNGTLNAQTSGLLQVFNTGFQGLYCYNKASNEAFPLTLNFTNNGNIRIDSTQERGIYNYTYRGQPLTFINNGNINISSTRYKGIYNLSDNDNAVLNFTNNGSIAIDTTREEGLYNQATQANPTLTAVLNFTNNGNISIDSTKLDGLQNFGNRGQINFTNGMNGIINITRTREYGIINQNREDQANFATAMNFTNMGTIAVNNTLFAGWHNYNERGNLLQVQNSGTITLNKAVQYGLYNRCYNSVPNPPDYSYDSTNLSFTNNGTLTTDSTQLAGIYNYADAGDNLHFTNNGSIDIQHASEQGIYNRSRKSGTFTPVLTFRNNGGNISIQQTTLPAVYNYANNDSLYFYNNAGLQVLSSGSHGIYNFVENNTSVIQFTNQPNGLISIQNTTLNGIYNHTTRSGSTQTNALSFVNSGEIDISNITGRAIHNYDYRCNFFTFTNTASGTIRLHNLSQDALYNETNTTSAAYPMSSLLLTNQGSILIENLTDIAQPLYNNNTNSLLQVNNSGNITISDVPKNGIISQCLYTNATDYAATALTFTTTGNINILNTGEEGLRNINYGGAYNFSNTGNIWVTSAGREGIENAGYANTFNFTNNGSINLFNNAFEDFYNTNSSTQNLLCTNQTCGLMRTDGKFKNNADCTFTNNGLIETSFTFNHSNQGIFINNGIIEAPVNFNATPVPVQNNATILPYIVTQPLTICGNLPVSPAVNNPANVYTIGGWFTNPSAGISAGTYTAANNTFTPDALPQGNHTLYIQMTDNVTGCNRVRPIAVAVYEQPQVSSAESAIICAGDDVPVLSVQSANPDVNFNWYSVPAGGSPVFSGAQFTPTLSTEIPALHTWYVEAVTIQGGCQSAARTPVTLNILPLPAAPIAVTDTITVNEGDPVPPLQVQSAGTNIAFNWFTQAIGGTPVFTGNAYAPNIVIPGIYTWFAESINTSTGCVSRSRTALTMVIIDLPYVLFRAKVRLQGPFNAATGLMSTQLQSAGLLPYFQPFYDAPWYYPGYNEDVGSTANIPPTVTDWILIEARNAANPDIIAEQRAVFLRNDGTVIDIDGTEGVQFFFLNPNTAYFLIARSRNHLAVMSSVPVTLPNFALYDFTLPTNVMGGSAQLAALGSGLFGLPAGDMNANGIISVADFNIYMQQSSFTNNYLNADLNLDKNVTIADFNLLQPNLSRIGVLQVRY